MRAIGAPDWRGAIEATLPGAAKQAEKDAATTFEVEIPALQEWVFDGERSSRISQPVLYVSGGESGPLFEAARQHFQSLIPQTDVVVVPGVNHLMQMSHPELVAAPLAHFLSAHPF
jgi:pimeloyl-ACP methyl ester carboxylesterase